MKPSITALVLALIAFTLAACAEKKGPMQRAGENLDDAVEEVSGD